MKRSSLPMGAIWLCVRVRYLHQTNVKCDGSSRCSSVFSCWHKKKFQFTSTASPGWSQPPIRVSYHLRKFRKNFCEKKIGKTFFISSFFKVLTCKWGKKIIGRVLDVDLTLKPKCFDNFRFVKREEIENKNDFVRSEKSEFLVKFRKI